MITMGDGAELKVVPGNGPRMLTTNHNGSEGIYIVYVKRRNTIVIYGCYDTMVGIRPTREMTIPGVFGSPGCTKE